MPSLKGPLLRIERANAHLQDLEGQLDAYEPNSYEVSAYEDANRALYAVLLKLRRPPPAICGLLVGDAIHNLRSCLDNLIWQLSTLNPNFPKKGPSTEINFPIFKTRNDRDFNSRLKFLPEKAIPIVDSLQPYHIGDDAKFHPLLILNRLANADKHNTIQVAALRLRIMPPSIKGAEVRVLKDGQILFLVPLGAKEQFHRDYDLTGHISIEIPREGFSANIGVLWEIRDYVRDDVLPKFSEFLPTE